MEVLDVLVEVGRNGSKLTRLEARDSKQRRSPTLKSVAEIEGDYVWLVVEEFFVGCTLDVLSDPKIQRGISGTGGGKFSLDNGE